MKSPKQFLLLFLGLLICFGGNAQRVISADLTYRCLGGENYEFTLTTYRDCSTISALPSSYFINVFSQTCGILPVQFKVNLYSKKEISASCPTKKSFCKGGDQPGFEKYVFKGTYTLSKQCTDWQFNWLECPRPGSISNIQSPDSSCISTRAVLNNKDFGCISSPVFENELTGFVCKDGANTLNLGVKLTGDSLAFTSITPYRSFDPSNGNPLLVTYANGFSQSKPISTNLPFTVNNKTGDISFTPSVANEKVIVAVKVDQFRNKKLISSVMKDQQIFVYNCVLPSMIFSGPTGNVCAKTPITINMASSDASGNKTSISWNNGIPQGIFTVVGEAFGTYTANQKASFKWIPSNSEAGPRSFVVKVKNDACPIFGEKSYTFNFNVIPSVDIQLRDDTLVPCGKKLPIKAKITGGLLPYRSIKWNSGETTDSIYKSAGKYILTVIDNNNCSVSDSVLLNSGVGANFQIASSTCAGLPLQFRDLSTTVSSIISWSWKFGTNGSLGTSIIANPTITVNTAGEIPVSLTVRDNNGCVDEKIVLVAVCSTPEYSLSKKDTCVNNASVIFSANSKVCPLSYQTINWGGGASPNVIQSYGNSSNSITGSLFYTYPYDPTNNQYSISGTIGNSGNCTSNRSLTIKVYPKPIFVIPANDTIIYFNCTSPTITLSGLASTAVQGALPPLTYSWSTGAIPLNNATTQPNMATVNDTLSYTAITRDARGCSDSRNFYVRYPIRPDFFIKGRCAQGDTFEFDDVSSISGSLATRTWDFGDATTITGTQKLQHVFPKETAYNVKLTIKHSSGCELSKTKSILNSVPKSRMSNFSSCFGKEITLLSPSSDSISGILDRLVWKIKNRNLIDSTWYNKDSTVLKNPEDLPYFNPAVSFFVPGDNHVYAHTSYNYSCKTTFKNTIHVYREIKDSILVKTQTCYNPDSNMHFKALKQVSDNPLYSRTWVFVDPVNGVPFNPKTILYTQLPLANYDTAIAINSSRIDTGKVTTMYIRLTTIDDKGCAVEKSSYFRNEILSKNDFELKGRCVNDDSTGIFIKNLNPINVGGAILFDLNKWDIDGDTIIRGFPTGIFHRFEKSGLNKVVLTCYNLDSTCSITTTKNLNILPVPQIDFRAESVCANDTSSFVNLTLPASPGDSIIKYRWTVENGQYISNDLNIMYKYPSPGTFKVRLYALNSTLCKDSIEKSVTVYPRPTANFSIVTDNNSQQTGVPIDFIDKTTYADNIVTWKWVFTKRDSVTYLAATNPSFTFDSLSVFYIKQKVTNNLGCSDDTIQRLDLNSYLILPTAFSPNDDKENDKLYLLYKGIRSLKEFRVYNRFGEKVFDGGNDLNASWDGTQNQMPSPVGSYVYYVIAENIYGKNLALKGNLTLLR